MIAAIVCTSLNGVIGHNQGMPWGRFSTDLRRFKEITNGHTIIMGRKTFESLPGILPNRRHIVISKSPKTIKGVTMASSIIQAIAKAGYSKVFIIGGGEIYKQAMPLIDELFITTIHTEYEGDTFFPLFERNDWKVCTYTRKQEEDIDYSFEHLRRM